jgi:ribosome-binding protein aMBF1 (putative translation factor)
MVLWSLGGSFIGWVSGDSDPNKEGSSAWCRTNNVAEDYCAYLIETAESRGMAPSEYLNELKESDQLVSTVEEGSYRWCRDRALSREECDNVNELAETFGESPQSVYETLLKAVDIINEGGP